MPKINLFKKANPKLSRMIHTFLVKVKIYHEFSNLKDSNKKKSSN